MRQIAEALLQIEAVTLSPEKPYTWSSGMKSPIYCDNRLTLSYPDVRNLIIDALVEAVRPLDVDVIAGTATAGIPHATLVADRLGMPLVYVRSSAKGHGKGNQIEGRFEPGARVVVIEDLLSTGSSSIEAAKAIQEAGGEVVKIQAIFSYSLSRLHINLLDSGFTAHALITLSDVLDVAVKKRIISKEEVASLHDWRNDPTGWSERVLSS
ncbi:MULTISPECIES: orotate phosphoribosyltransferase [Exiguobacterium]|uniref:orotate phosphoribosyltransferase n=1 Tax=Exiguobacterium TaxID=33986 RepID=UPI001BE7957F|nr:MULTISPECIES: orotate phosphoribosyltransferase [Exiguobacterium]MCT4776320.1 orotate phosphoribosyltransferase [Exiguobacterium aquaticum]MCT4789037.1 orotate phosphoribosyltransferase [Exiguobacterium mexicanum]